MWKAGGVFSALMGDVGQSGQHSREMIAENCESFLRIRIEILQVKMLFFPLLLSTVYGDLFAILRRALLFSISAYITAPTRVFHLEVCVYGSGFCLTIWLNYTGLFPFPDLKKKQL